MGTLVCFPHHVRASAGSRAAKTVSISAVKPASEAFLVLKMEDHHSAGMLSRCHHFETAGAPAPTSAAMASLEGHNSITLWNEPISAMPPRLGQIVLKRKDKVALDCNFSLGHTVRMAESETEAEYKQAFIARVRSARIATGRKQWELAELLNIPQDYYKHWESTRLMPHHMIGRFCLACRIDPEWLLTGRGEKPLKAPHAVDTEPEPVRRPRRSKRSKAA